MAFCTKCGESLSPGLASCPSCSATPYILKASLLGGQATEVRSTTDLSGLRTEDSRTKGSATPPAGVALEVGQILAGRYEIRRFIGAGSIGAVYSAFDNIRAKEVAIKIILPLVLQNKQAREDFLKAARASCEMSHPNIVRVYDLSWEKAYHLLVMELLDGKTLRTEMDERAQAGGHFGAQAVGRIGKSLCEALSSGHKFSLHGDLKPQNIWLCKDGTIKIANFGIAFLVGSGQLATTKLAMGTAYYAAPEQMQNGNKIDTLADQYSVGVILYEMLTGNLPVGRAKSVSEIRSDVPKELSLAIDRALEPKSAARYETLEEFGRALSNSTNGAEIRQTNTSRRSGIIKLSQLVRRWPVGAASLALLAIFGIFIFLHYRSVSVRDQVLARQTRQTAIVQFRRDRDRPELERQLLKALSLNPSYAQPRFDLGILAEGDEDWQAAYEWFRQYRRLEPNSKMSVLAQIELDRIPAIEKLDSTPEGKKTRRYDDAVARSKMLFNSGLLKESVAAASGAVKIDNSRWEAYAIIGAALARENRFDLAGHFLAEAADRAPADKKPIFQKATDKCAKEKQAQDLALAGSKALSDRNYSLAASNFDKAWDLDPTNNEYGLGAAVALVKLHKNSAASDDLNRLLTSRDPKVVSRAKLLLAKLDSSPTVSTIRRSRHSEAASAEPF
jgi:serine/threonine protein kinase